METTKNYVVARKEAWRLHPHSLAFTTLMLITCISQAVAASQAPEEAKAGRFRRQEIGESKFSGKSKREAFAKSCEFDEKGLALEAAGKPGLAVEQYKKAIVAYPTYAVNYCNLGNALADLNKYSEAITQYKKAVEIKPDFAAAYSNTADAMAKQKDYVGAELACKSAIRVDPGYVPAMTNLAEVYINTNRPHEAITVLNKARGLSTTLEMKKIIATDLGSANKLLYSTASGGGSTASRLESSP